MPSLLKPADRDAMVHRLRQLEPSTPARWGTFTAPRMICHLADALRVGLGDLPAQRVDTLPRRTLLKWLVVYSPISPPPGKIQTAPEMLTSTPTNWEQDMAGLQKLIGRAAATPTTVAHPFFGPLSHGGWGRLAWKHIDHHLRQFGC